MADYFIDENENFDSITYDDDLEFNNEIKFSFDSIFNSCIKPSSYQIVFYIGQFLLWNILFRILTQTIHISSNLRHIISIITGLILTYTILDYNGVYYLLFYTILVYFFMKFLIIIKVKKLGYIVGLFSIVQLIFCELYEKDPKIWHQIRGTQMIAAMKLISLNFDLDSGRLIQFPDFLSIFGYMICPANSIIGPWVPFAEYLSIYDRPKWNLQWIIRVIVNSLFAIMFLICSNCLIPSLISDNSWKWSVAYRDAMSFRSSHYFISFLSQSIMVTGGFHKFSDSYFFGYQITKPILIEIPRSIVQVVVAWNIPMHNWLKFYVFRNMKPHGIFTAIVTTYIVSALLHGINFQLSAVLLSLGFYTYIEYQLRQKLSNIFKACISSNECRANCPHEYNSSHIYVIFVNLLFGMISVIHLTYLGVMFEASTNIQEEGYSTYHALNKWNSLDFTSHWIALFCYMFYILI